MNKERLLTFVNFLVSFKYWIITYIFICVSTTNYFPYPTCLNNWLKYQYNTYMKILFCIGKLFIISSMIHIIIVFIDSVLILNYRLVVHDCKHKILTKQNH